MIKSKWSWFTIGSTATNLSLSIGASFGNQIQPSLGQMIQVALIGVATVMAIEFIGRFAE